eukprot:m.344224 g.344224  ORF g.344224 m.344224 type:complete len:338 (-) comp20642_c0_seq23:1299-2312(-)
MGECCPSQLMAAVAILLLSSESVVSAVAAVSAPQTCGPQTICKSNSTCCPDTFSDTQYGCCVLPNAVCCHTPLGSGLARNYCCPQGSQCSTNGCVPVQHNYPCGPSQGNNCSVSFTCSPGPLPWVPEEGIRNVVVIGDSVSIGWTPVLKQILANATGKQRAFVTHSPASGDGGARSTSDMLQCFDYRLSTSVLEPLPLSPGDIIVFNFGLHDYNLGLGGADEYETELLSLTQKMLKATKAKLLFVLTTPVHNGASPEDNPTVVELNVRATKIMKQLNIPILDLYNPIISKCGPVPWADDGPSACSLCAPECKKLVVHYTPTGYEFIAAHVASKLEAL